MADPSTSTIPSPSQTPASSSPSANKPITLRSPRKYNHPLPNHFTTPSPSWLQRTWTVTHSTLPMWRSAKNVRITYTILPSGQLEDIVSSEPITKTLMPQPKSIKGIDTPDHDEGKGEEVGGAWKWRGCGWLRVANSRWEVLGWGEESSGREGGREGEEMEKWVVTWFAPSLFTPAGVDVYSSRKEGISEALYGRIQAALEGLEEREVGELCRKEMRGIRIDDAGV